MKNINALFGLALPFILLLISCVEKFENDKFYAFSTNEILNCYSYIDPTLKEFLKTNDILESDLLRYVSNIISDKKIMSHERNRVYEGSIDSLRVDLREDSNRIKLTLSVRQGASVHNMLERWKKINYLDFDTNRNSELLKESLYRLIDSGFSDLVSRTNSDSFKSGKMMMWPGVSN